MRPGASTPLPPTHVGLTGQPNEPALLASSRSGLCCLCFPGSSCWKWSMTWPTWRMSTCSTSSTASTSIAMRMSGEDTTLHSVSAGSVIHVRLPFASPCFECWVWKSPSSTWLIYLVVVIHQRYLHSHVGWERMSENLIMFADWCISIL